jgi:hypothetical protein
MCLLFIFMCSSGFVVCMCVFWFMCVFMFMFMCKFMFTLVMHVFI